MYKIIYFSASVILILYSSMFAECDCQNLLNKAEALFEENEYDEAVRFLENYINTEEYIYKDRALMLLAAHTRDGEKSVEYWKEIINTYSNSGYYTQALYYTAQFYYTKGQYYNSADYYERIAALKQLDYMYFASLYGAGISYKFAGNFEKAEEFLLKTSAPENKDRIFYSESKSAYADILLQEGKLDEAVKIYEDLLLEVDFQKQAPILLRLGLLYKQQEDRKNALKYFRKVFDQYPNTLSSKVAAGYIKDLGAETEKQMVDNEIKYFVQVGIFKSVENVKKIAEFAEEKDFDYRIEKKNDLSIIMIGPFKTQDTAFEHKNIFDKEFQVDSKIILQ